MRGSRLEYSILICLRDWRLPQFGWRTVYENVHSSSFGTAFPFVCEIEAWSKKHAAANDVKNRYSSGSHPFLRRGCGAPVTKSGESGLSIPPLSERLVMAGPGAIYLAHRSSKVELLAGAFPDDSIVAGGDGTSRSRGERAQTQGGDPFRTLALGLFERDQRASVEVGSASRASRVAVADGASGVSNA